MGEDLLVESESTPADHPEVNSPACDCASPPLPNAIDVIARLGTDGDAHSFRRSQISAANSLALDNDFAVPRAQFD